MGLKLRVAERVLGRSVAEEYVAAARERYEAVLAQEHAPPAFPPDDELAAGHVASEHRAANLYKVKARMLLTRRFIREQLDAPLNELRVLDVGGASAVFFRLLGVGPDRGTAVNVLARELAAVRAQGYAAVRVADERLPFADQSFDCCLSMQCLEHTRSPAVHLSELARVARLGVFVSIPYRAQTRVAALATGAPADQHVFELCGADLARLAAHCGLRLAAHTALALEAPGAGPLRRTFRARLGFGGPTAYLAFLTPEHARNPSATGRSP